MTDVLDAEIYGFPSDGAPDKDCQAFHPGHAGAIAGIPFHHGAVERPLLNCHASAAFLCQPAHSGRDGTIVSNPRKKSNGVGEGKRSGEEKNSHFFDRFHPGNLLCY